MTPMQKSFSGFAVFAAVALVTTMSACAAASASDGSVLPFPLTPSASIAKPRLQDSTMTRRV
jgi:arylsulfatase